MAINDIINKARTAQGFINTGINAIDGFTGRGRDGQQNKFNIQRLKSQIHSNNGLMRPNLFLVRITNPPCVEINTEVGSQLLCSSATLPGKMLTVQPHRRLGYGPEDRRVTNAVMPDVTLTFFIGNNGQPLTYFNEWFEYMFYTNVTKGPMARSAKDQPVFTVGFRNKYCVPIEIITYDQMQNNILKYTLHEAFPMQIGDVSLAWAENDSFASLAVNFTYRYYTLDTLPAPEVNTATSGGFLAAIRNGMGVINRLQTTGPANLILQTLNVASAQKLF